jgi:hypothetical protein
MYKGLIMLSRQKTDCRWAIFTKIGTDRPNFIQEYSTKFYGNLKSDKWFSARTASIEDGRSDECVSIQDFDFFFYFV